MRHRITLIGLALCGLLSHGAADASVIIKDLHFDVAGQLPSSEPDIELVNTTGLPESALYDVAQGVLAQHTLSANGFAAYFYPAVGPQGGDLDPGRTTVAEARLRVLGVQGRFGAELSVFDGLHNVGLDFSPGTVNINNWWASGGSPAQTAASIPMDISVFHVYRLVLDVRRDSLDLFVDGEHIISVVVPDGALFANGFEFGDGKTAAGNGADVEWDYITVLQYRDPSTIKDLRFDVAGQLPSSEPDIELVNTTGLPESALYDVAQGVLAQHTLSANGFAAYFYPAVGPQGGDLDPGRTTVAEARLRVLGVQGRFGAELSVFDGLHNVGLDFSPGTVNINNWWASGGSPAQTAASIPMDISVFHVYRLVLDVRRDSLDVFVDGEHIISVGVPDGAFVANGFEFGDGKTAAGNGADVEWDYITVLQCSDVSGVVQTPQSSEPDFQLFAVPNPFRQSATLSFHLARTSHVTVSVYDILGRCVDRLVNRPLPAGLSVVEWSIPVAESQPPAGVYYARIVVDGKAQSMKLTRIK